MGFFPNYHYLSGKFQKTEMNRTFHARIWWAYIPTIILATVGACWCLWLKNVTLGLLFLLGLIGTIEGLIHTAYTITDDGKLVITQGRFSKTKEIKVAEVTKVQQTEGRLTHGVDVWYGQHGYVKLYPVNEEEFIHVLEKRKKELTDH